jgi:hypothetical protein
VNALKGNFSACVVTSFRRLLVVGSLADIEAHRYRSQANPKAIIASLTAFEVRYSLPVCFRETPEAAAVQVERWAFYFLRERLNAAADTMRRYGEQAPTPPPDRFFPYG